MSLLPRCVDDFGKEEFWNSFFSKLKSKPFEWYGEYDNLCEILDKYIRAKEKILVVGCGNSRLSADLYDVGFQNITNIDISTTVIQQMREKYAQKCPCMSFEAMDMLQMTMENEVFNVVLDKGTLDAIMVNSLSDTLEKVDKMLAEISRVLKFGGRYICISLLQEHVLQKLLDWFLKESWMVRISRCFGAEKMQEKFSNRFPVFIVVCTKMKKNVNSLKVLELALDAQNIPQRASSEAEVMESIKSVQYFVLLRHALSKRKLPGENICLDLCCAKTGKIKYHLYVVDIEKSAAIKFAIFIVPLGRETDWMFSTAEGRLECALNADCERLVIVHLSRNFDHKDLEKVKQDLSSSVMELAPNGLKTEVPFLSIGDDVCSRKICVSGQSEISGKYVVEDVTIGNSDKEIYRRMIFLNKPYLIQSEAKLKKVRKKRKNKYAIDFNYLACTHHSFMVAGLAFLGPQMIGPKILQIGLGGGGLAMYLHTHFPTAKLDVVEIDPVIVDIAKNWFGVITDESLSVHLEDGLIFLKQMADRKMHYDVLIIDVDSKEMSVGISCPPSEFVTEALLCYMSQLVGKFGVVLLNLVCRDAKLRREVYSVILSKFEIVFCKSVPNEVNEILYCMNYVPSENFLHSVQINAVQLNEHIKQHSCSEGFFNVTDIIENVQRLSVNA